MPISPCGLIVKTSPAGPPGPPGASGLAGNTQFPTGDYVIVAGDGYVMFDLTNGSRIAFLGAAASDIDVTIKDYLGLASVTTTITAQGYVDGQLNPVLVNLPRAWARLKYTAATTTWSLLG